MKRLLLLLFITAVCLSASAQRVYFLYIQSESEQPFYVKMNEKIYSSAAKGYLILPQLRDSSYNFSVGFPGKTVGEQKFAVSMSGKDHGYILKNFEAKGWGLFDLQGMSTLMSVNNLQSAEEKKSPMKKDESVFTQILAKASDDSTLLEKPDIPKMKEEKKADVVKEEIKPQVKNETAKQPEQKPEEKKTEIVKTELKEPEIKEILKQPEQKVEEKKAEPIVQKPAETKKEDPPVEQIKEEQQPAAIEYKRSEVIRKSESSTTEGFGVTFIDEYANGEKDTIRIFIPQLKTETPTDKPSVKEEKRFLEITTDTVKAAPVEIIKEEKPVQPKSEPVAVTRKNNCASVASESDFLKLRKKMAGESDDSGMITEASKVFKGKCFTTEQIKNLGVLFLRDEGKYKFFDAAYSYVSDLENFSSLQNELKDEYYITRFKAMLR